MLFLEGVGEVPEQDQSEDDVHAFGGVLRPAQVIGHGPQPGLMDDRGALDQHVFTALDVGYP